MPTDDVVTHNPSSIEKIVAFEVINCAGRGYSVILYFTFSDYIEILLLIHQILIMILNQC